MRFFTIFLLASTLLCCSSIRSLTNKPTQKEKKVYCQYGWSTGGYLKTDTSEITWRGFHTPDYCFPLLNDSAMDTYKKFNARIYNRWGEKLFETNLKHEYWVCNDDSAKCPAPEGTYFSILLIERYDGSLDTFTSTATLIEFEK